MRTSVIALFVALVALATVAEANRDLKLVILPKILGRDPNGFSVRTGFGVGAEVDEVEAEVDLGPFGFTLDPLEVPDEDDEDDECNQFCDPATGLVFCCESAGVGCELSGGFLPGCSSIAGATAGAGYGYGYPSYGRRKSLK